MKPQSNEDLWRQISICLDAVGAEKFQANFLNIVEVVGADQCMIFSYRDGQAECLLARSFIDHKAGNKLAETYLDGWFFNDPLYPEVMALISGTTVIFEMQKIKSAMNAEYVDIFFGKPEITDKISVLSVGDQLRISVNFYKRSPDSAWLLNRNAIVHPIARIMGKLALLHYELSTTPNYPQPLSVLSNREREVCLGVLRGRKAEAIAADLSITPNSVVTYRRRAYAKLGVSSRTDLFTLCEG